MASSVDEYSSPLAVIWPDRLEQDARNPADWRKQMNAEGVKNDTGKPPVSLIYPPAVLEEARVMGFGAQKYAAHNWRKGMAHTRLSDAAMRHVLAWVSGEDLDPESGLSHLAHARCCLGILMGLIDLHPELDDRYGQS